MLWRDTVASGTYERHEAAKDRLEPSQPGLCLTTALGLRKRSHPNLAQLLEQLPNRLQMERVDLALLHRRQRRTDGREGAAQRAVNCA